MGSRFSTKACAGCRDDFYNGKNDLGVTRCWSADSAVMRTRYRTHVDSRPDEAGAFEKVRVPSCYRVSRFVFVDKLPDVAVEALRKRIANLPLSTMEEKGSGLEPWVPEAS